MSPVARLLHRHPHWPAASRVLAILHQAGHHALLAGGCVRDACLGLVAQDLDLATSATPDEVLGLFPRTVEVGKSFGVVRVLDGDADLEVATFRRDLAYADGRRPTGVEFTDAIEDARRRDFTVNALFYDLRHDRVEDYVAGLPDLAAQILRTVGEPARRFREDHLRLLRAVRFAVQLSFKIEDSTWNEVRASADLIRSVSGERVRDELTKTLRWGGERGPRLLHDSGLQAQLFPQLELVAEATVRGAAKLRDVQPESGRMTPDFVLARWLAPAVRAKPDLAVAEFAGKMKLSRNEEKLLLRRLSVLANPSLLRDGSPGEQIERYDEVAVREAWDFLEALDGRDEGRAALDHRWRAVLSSGRLPPPFVNGDDLRSEYSGRELGEALRATYHAQLERRFADRDGALTWARAYRKIPG